MGAFEDDWIENAPNGVSYDDWRSGAYLEPGYWERKRYGSSYKSTEDKLKEANDTIKQMQNKINKLCLENVELGASVRRYKSEVKYYKTKYYKLKYKYGKHYSKFNDTDVSN